MDFLVLMKSIERNVCHSPDVLLAHFLIAAVLVSWSLFWNWFKGSQEDWLFVPEKTGLTVKELHKYIKDYICQVVYIVHQPLSSWLYVVPCLISFKTLILRF